MLHIILLILKIIGIILLSILGIILLLLLAVLFIPVRYKADFSIYDCGSAKCMVSWFLRAFSINLCYGRDKNGKMSFDKYVRILGIRTGLLFGKDDGTEKNGYKEQDISEEIKEDFSKENYSKEKPGYTEPVDVKTDEVKDLFKEETERISFDEISLDTTDKQQYEESHTQNDDIFKKIKRVFNKFLYRLKKIWFKIKSIYGRIKKAYKKAASIKEFLEMEETGIAITFLKEQAGIFFNQIKPRKVTGRIKFGTGDPASTGQLLGLIYIFFKGANDKFIIEADFDNKALEGEIHLKGRVTVFGILVIAVRLYRNKNLKNTINRGKNLKEE